MNRPLERIPPTSRHRKVPAPAPQLLPAAPGRGPDLLRRALLGLATGLIAARALLPAEDVGLLEPGSNAMGLVIPLLWLVGLAAWAAWRSWSRQLDWYGGLAEAGLLLFVLFAFLSAAFGAAYTHPAWIVSWEWAGLVAAFFLVRQIARAPADQRGLLAALLATAVSLSVQFLYQSALPDRGRAPLPGLTAEELPRLRCEALAKYGSAPQNAFPGTLSLPSLAASTSPSDPTLFERIATRNNVNLESGEPALPLALRPAPAEFATFADRSHLAGCLALLLPALVGCVLAAWLGGVPRWQLGVAIGCALLAAAALALTLVRSAILPCLLIGAAAPALAWRYYSSRVAGPARRLLLLLALAGPAALLVLAFVLQSRGGSGLDDLKREWSAAWAMIRAHLWLGVGPGNYGRFYPQYMAANAPTFARQPSSFVLEVWATMGLPALAALALALVSFFRRTLMRVPAQGQGTDDVDQGTRWEFYEGGMVGLVVGFFLRALPAGQETIVPEAIAAGVRAVVWFAVFALIHGIRWGGATRVLACTAGVAALLLHLAVSGGFSVPGVCEPLLILAALALNGLPERPVPVGRQFVGRVLPLAFATAAALMCLLQLYGPLTSAAASARSGRADGQKYLDVRSGVTRSLTEGQIERLRREALKSIVKDFEDAVQADPSNARHWVDLANWNGTAYERNFDDRYYQHGLVCALAAQKRDPLGEAGYLAESRLHRLAQSKASTLDARQKAVEEAPKPLYRLAKYRPFDAQLQYRLAVVLFGSEAPAAGKSAAEEALKLDAAAPTPERRLTMPQRQQARRFAEAP